MWYFLLKVLSSSRDHEDSVLATELQASNKSTHVNMKYLLIYFMLCFKKTKKKQQNIANNNHTLKSILRFFCVHKIGGNDCTEHETKQLH